MTAFLRDLIESFHRCCHQRVEVYPGLTGFSFLFYSLSSFLELLMINGFIKWIPDSKICCKKVTANFNISWCCALMESQCISQRVTSSLDKSRAKLWSIIYPPMHLSGKLLNQSIAFHKWDTNKAKECQTVCSVPGVCNPMEEEIVNHFLQMLGGNYLLSGKKMTVRNMIDPYFTMYYWSIFSGWELEVARERNR